MKRDLTITTGVAAALLISGCGQRDRGWTAVGNTALCTDSSGRRVADGDCRRPAVHGAAHWYFVGRGTPIPYLGEPVSGGSYTRALRVSYASAPAGTAMTRSAAVVRGGFGASARGAGAGVGE